MQYRRLFLSAFLVALVVLAALNYFTRLPRAYDEYFALYTLGAYGKAEHYFPNDQADLLPGVHISWFVMVYNHMPNVELARVEIKLLNLTMQGPDQLANLPSQGFPFYDRSKLLMPNETWVLPISWSVSNATKDANMVTIHSLLFNGKILSENLNVSAQEGHFFRIMIELWVYDEAGGAFSFKWVANGMPRCAWNEIWFNMTRVSLLPA